ncbi:unnamed protein product [Caretta caretta]
MSSLPPELQAIWWSVGPLLYLSIYLFPTHLSPENWQDLEARVGDWLRRWTGLLWYLSLWGRALVFNQLVLFVLWHRLNTLSSAPGILAQLQRLALEFFWPGLHWISTGVLSLPLEEGGQDLVCLGPCLLPPGPVETPLQLRQSGVEHFGTRLPPPPPRAPIQLAALFLHLRGLPRNLSEQPVFYQDLLWTWKLLSAIRSMVALEGADLLVEPLLHKPHLRVQVVESSSVCLKLVLAETTKI